MHGAARMTQSRDVVDGYDEVLTNFLIDKRRRKSMPHAPSVLATMLVAARLKAG
jgi:hypothetical protein